MASRLRCVGRATRPNSCPSQSSLTRRWFVSHTGFRFISFVFILFCFHSAKADRVMSLFVLCVSGITQDHGNGCWPKMVGIGRDQPNSRFHGRDIFREIGLLLWRTSISVKFREIRDFFSWILTLLHSFMKVFRVLSTAFVQILLFATCHTSALSSWHVFTVLLTYFQSWLLT